VGYRLRWPALTGLNARECAVTHSVAHVGAL
jgi:hypothetical protein